jgi:hypothetical protein
MPGDGDGDGDARGLEAAAAAAAEAARELREAAAALVATRAAEEDALRRRAVALDADVRRLQGSLPALDPSAVDKVLPRLLYPVRPPLPFPGLDCPIAARVPSTSQHARVVLPQIAIGFAKLNLCLL